MKSATTTYIDKQKQKQGAAIVRQVKYKRRYWNGSAYVYESNWQTLAANAVSRYGQIIMKLDTPLLNETKTSNVHLALRNDDYQWLETNTTSGIFRPSLSVPQGYFAPLTMFQFQLGYVNVNNTSEFLTVFTGVMVDYILSTDKAVYTAVVSGMEHLLQTYDAEDTCTVITGGATSQSGRQWTTNLTTIGDVINVYDNGTLKTQGVDYTVAQLNTYGSGAQINLTYDSTGPITYDGRQWFTAKKIEDLVTTICTNAGVTVNSIAPVTFGKVSSSTTLGSGGWGVNWDTVVGCSIGFSAYNSGVAPVINVTAGQWPSNAYNPNSYLYCGGNTNAYGVWQWGYTCSLPTVSHYADLVFLIDAKTWGNYASTGMAQLTGHGYFIRVSGDGSAILYYCNGGSIGSITQLTTISAASLAAIGVTDITAQHNWMVSRAADGTMRIFVDGTLIMSATDNNVITSTYFILGAGSNSAGSEQTVSSLTCPITWTNALTLTMADFTGLNGYDVIKTFAGLANFEFGFDADGSLYFRPKTANAPSMSITESDTIIKTNDFRPGWDAVIERSVVTYGHYVSRYDSSTAPEASPTSKNKFRRMVRSDDFSQFLIANDSGIALARAQLMHDAYYRPMRRCTASGKIVPQADLSDVWTVSYRNNRAYNLNVMNDPLNTWPAVLGQPTNELMNQVPMKIIGMTINLDTGQAEYDLQEVLS